MNTILVILGHEKYWIFQEGPDTIRSLVLRLDLSDYSTEAVYARTVAGVVIDELRNQSG